MKIQNKSIWNTNDLRKFLGVCFEKVGVVHKGYLIEIVNRNRGKYQIRGLARYDQKWIKLLLPINYETGSDGSAYYEDITELDLKELVQVTLHEIDHTRGLHHEDMINFRDIESDWVKNYQIRKGEQNG